MYFHGVSWPILTGQRQGNYLDSMQVTQNQGNYLVSMYVLLCMPIKVYPLPSFVIFGRVMYIHIQGRFNTGLFYNYLGYVLAQVICLIFCQHKVSISFFYLIFCQLYCVETHEKHWLNDEYHKSDPKIFIMGICIGNCEAIPLCQQNQNKLPIETGVERTHYVYTYIVKSHGVARNRPVCHSVQQQTRVWCNPNPNRGSYTLNLGLASYFFLQKYLLVFSFLSLRVRMVLNSEFTHI